MSKRWTLKDDIFLVEYRAIGLDYVASHDLGFKSKGAGEKRAKLLKETGIWDKIIAYIDAKAVMTSWHTLYFSGDRFALEVSIAELESRGLDIPDWRIPLLEAKKEDAA